MNCERVCRFYLKGHCNFGNRCRNYHPLKKDNICQYYLKDKCKYGDKCINIHSNPYTKCKDDYECKIKSPVEYLTNDILTNIIIRYFDPLDLKRVLLVNHTFYDILTN